MNSAATAKATMAALADEPFHPAERRGVPHNACLDAVERLKSGGIYLRDPTDDVLVMGRSWLYRHCGEWMFVIKVFPKGCPCGRHWRRAHTSYRMCACTRCNKRHMIR